MYKGKIRPQIKPILLGFLGSLVALLPVWGQALPPGARRIEPLEKYDNPPPAYIFRAETSAGMVSPYGPFTSHQVNVDAGGHNILGDAANEPSICVDPTNANKMVIGWRQFDSISSNFRQAGYGYTSDGGTTWTFPGVLQNNVFRSDPVLNSDSVGNFFYLSLLQNFFDDLWRSLSRGQSWARLAAATGGDKEWFTIDRANGFQYQCWSTAGDNYGTRQFSRSTNGGITWMNPIDIPNQPIWGTLDVDATGNLFIGGGDAGSQFWCIRSSNAKNAAIIPTFDQVTAVDLGGSIVSSGLINPEGLAGQIFLAVDRSGTATNNNIYMLASVQPTGATSGTDVMFVRSTDGGRTFSAPRRINDDPINHNKWHWFGTFSVAPNGRLDAVWLDTRNAANNTDSQLFYSSSRDGGSTWSRNIALSNSFNPFIGYPNQNKIGDYITIVSDNASGNVAYSATFNGEEDVYYLRVPQSNGGSVAGVADFNGDGHPDYLLFNSSTRQTAIWYLNNNVLTSSLDGPTLPAGWSVAGVADFNRDAHPDYLLSNSRSRQTAIWYLNNNVFTSSLYGSTLPVGWSVVGVADFDGDGHPDYLLFNSNTRQTAIWYLNNNVFTSSLYGPTLPVGWGVVGVADFNGDGHADYLLFNSRTRQTAIWYLNNNVFASSLYGPTLPVGWSMVGVADFNGDGHPDYLLSNSRTRLTAIWYLNNNVFVSSLYGPGLSAD